MALHIQDIQHVLHVVEQVGTACIVYYRISNGILINTEYTILTVRK